jgi:hypothetical protein
MLTKYSPSSSPLQVKTQRALNDYRKSAYPHYKDELTRLRYIGAITAARLKDARAWLGKDVPLECVDSVQSLKQLLEYVDTNRCGSVLKAQLKQRPWLLATCQAGEATCNCICPDRNIASC